MRTMRLFDILIAGFAISLALISIGSCTTPTDPKLLAQVDTASLRAKTLDRIVFELSNRVGVHAAVELAAAPTSAADKLDLTLSPTQTVASILDAATAADGHYTWQYTNGWIHLIPRDRGQDYLFDQVLTQPIPAGGGASDGFQQLVKPYGVQGWQTVYASFGPCAVCGTASASAPPPPVAAPAGEITVREAIDVIVQRRGGKAWSAMPRLDDKGNRIGTTLLVSL